MNSTVQGELIFAGIVALPLIFYGIIGFLRSEIDMPLAIRFFYVIRVPVGRIKMSGASATVTSLGCLIPGLLLGVLIIVYLLHRISMSIDILFGLSFVALLVASLGILVGFIVKLFTGK